MDLLKQFTRFEKEKNLFALRYKGIYYWQLIRFGVYQRFLQGNEEYTRLTTGSLTFVQKLGFLRGLPQQFFRYWFAKPAEVFFAQSARKMVVGGQPRYHFSYFLQKQMPGRIDLFTAFQQRGCQPDDDSKYTDSWLQFKLALGAQAVRLQFWHQNDNGDLAILRTWLEEMAESTGVFINIEEIVVYAKVACRVFLQARRHFTHLLKKGYHSVALVGHYSNIHFALTSAAHQLGISVAELQHGIASNHVAYTYASLDADGKMLPDKYLAYGAFWKEQLCLPRCVRVTVTGFPYIDYARTAYGKNKKYDTLVFYSQLPGGAQLSQLAVRFAKLVRGRMKVMVKFHPGEVAVGWRKLYPELAACFEIECVEESGVTYQLLAENHYAVGIFSTCLIEALAFANCAVTMACQGSKRMDHWVTTGGIWRVQDEYQLLELVTKRIVPNVDPLHYFADSHAGQALLDQILVNDSVSKESSTPKRNCMEDDFHEG